MAERLEDVLAAHGAWPHYEDRPERVEGWRGWTGWDCRCGWSGAGRDKEPYYAHVAAAVRAHLAALEATP